MTIRNQFCPLCNAKSCLLLRLRFNRKMNLPTEVEIRACESDNFVFVGGGAQKDYDSYYESIVNDTYHKEISGGETQSVVAKVQKEHLLRSLGAFFESRRKVFDFGCGEGSLLVELALQFPKSQFVGFDPSPAGSTGMKTSSKLGLRNLEIRDLQAALDEGPYDLVIASHVAEHLLNFDPLNNLGAAVVDGGLLYIEVPDALKYVDFQRREFLYYFDRLHVNHFTPQSLANVGYKFGFAEISKLEYSFPYRDGGEYPALGMLFRKDQQNRKGSKPSPSLLDVSNMYISQERKRAKQISQTFGQYDGILVWGAGDNFFRSAENGGPLSQEPNMIVLDCKHQEFEIGGRSYSTVEPMKGLQRFPWPVVITVSEGRMAIADQVKSLDPQRPILFV